MDFQPIFKPRGLYSSRGKKAFLQRLQKSFDFFFRVISFHVRAAKKLSNGEKNIIENGLFSFSFVFIKIQFLKGVCIANWKMKSIVNPIQFASHKICK